MVADLSDSSSRLAGRLSGQAPQLALPMLGASALVVLQLSWPRISRNKIKQYLLKISFLRIFTVAVFVAQR
jgi:hypothetical protein